MRNGRSIRLTGALGVALGAALGAQTAGVALTPNYPPGSTLLYQLTIHSAISSRATMDTDAEVEMRILPGAAPGRFEAALRFTRFHTQVKAATADDQKVLSQQAAATDEAALKMQAPEFQVTPEDFKVISRSAGPEYDQPVEMLAELARTDSLPTGTVQAGAHWTRHRRRPIPTMNASVELTMDCSLTALGAKNGQPTATIAVHSDGETALPPGSLPGSAEMAAQGLVPEAQVAFSTDSSSIYRVADAVLLQTTSETHNTMHIRFVGPNPNAQTTDTNIDSSATVKLERMEPGG